MVNLSDLPEGIIHQILSFMELDEGMQASLLCKPWLSAWRTRPNLDFYCPFKHIGTTDYTDKLRVFCEGFKNHIDQTLLRYRDQKIRIRLLKLSCGDDDKLEERWIATALENGVKVLHLTKAISASRMVLESKSLEELYFMTCQYNPGMMQVPEKIKCSNLKRLNLCCLHIDEVDFQRIISSCKMIEFLSLTKIVIQDGAAYRDINPESPGNPNLKRLRLYKVRLDEVKFQNIISSCKMIEYLKFDGCKGVHTCKVRGLPRLKVLYVSNCKKQTPTRVEVEAQSLEILYILNCNGGTIKLNLNASSLKYLLLRGVDMEDDFFLDLETKFPCLEDLIIDWFKGLHKIKISSPSLRKLELRSEAYQFRMGRPESEYELKVCPLKELQVDAPSLAYFTYFGGLVSSVSFASFSSYLVSEIRIEDFGRPGDSWFHLKEFLTQLNQSEISLHITFLSETSFNLEEEMKRNTQFPGIPLSVLSIKCETDKFDTALLDGVFWICRPKTIEVECFFGDHGKLIETLFSMLIAKRSNDNEEERKFWQRILKEVKFETLKSVLQLEWEP